MLFNKDDFRIGLVGYSETAYSLLPEMKSPNILDVGCGTGVSALRLAEISDCRITGVDIDQSSLDRMKDKFDEQGFSSRLKLLNCSLEELPFEKESFDIVWSEGSVQFIGFEKALVYWGSFLKHNGVMVIHHVPDDFMNKLMAIEYREMELRAYYLLDESVWWEKYLGPMEAALNQPGCKTDSAEARQCLDEIQMYHDNPKSFRSAYYIMKKA